MSVSCSVASYTQLTVARGEYHIVVLGAGGVGKSCLTLQFVQNIFVDSYDPTIEDCHTKLIEVDGRQCMLEILDTAGTEQFASMHELYMKSGQGFLLVFSITSMGSLNELSHLREQILRIKDEQKVPMVIVGNKSDLEDRRMVSRAKAFQVSQEWGGVPYYETSARLRANVNEAFQDLCRQMVSKEMASSQKHGQHHRHDRKHRTIRKNNNKTSKSSGMCTIV